MSTIRDEILAANAAYARSFGDKGKLAMPPARRFAVLTCMYARLDPARFAGLAEGDAHVVRNAGGRASCGPAGWWSCRRPPGPGRPPDRRVRSTGSGALRPRTGC
jgi:hypothetical protein